MTPKQALTVLATAVVLTVVFLAGEYTATKRTFVFLQLQSLKHRVLGQPTVATDTLNDYPYWRDRATLFESLTTQPHTVMVGDSLTDGAEWHELFPGASIANRGINGDTTHGVKLRMASIVAAHPRQAFLMLGNNDIGANRPMADTIQDCADIVDTLLAHRVQTFIQSTLYVGANTEHAAQTNAAIQQLNERLVALATQRGITYIDLNTSMAVGQTLDAQLTHDGVHLNAAGYQRWKRAIQAFVLP